LFQLTYIAFCGGDGGGDGMTSFGLALVTVVAINIVGFCVTFFWTKRSDIVKDIGGVGSY